MPYRSPSYSSFSGGAMTRQERAEAARANPAFNAWREATKRAAAQLQEKKASQPGAKTRGTGANKKFVVSRDELDALTEKYFRQAGFERSSRQSAAARSKRVHGMSTSKLHRPVSEDEAVDLFLQGYRRQAAEGHRTNPTGKRRYPSTGAVAQKISPDLRGKVIPDTVKRDFKDPRTALRSRMSRVAGVSPDSRGRVSGRKVVRACPPEAVGKDGLVTRKSARKYNCEDSWKLRRRSAWKNYQVPDVTHFDTPKSARSSSLYKRAGKQLPTTATSRGVSHLAPYKTFPRRRKVQSPGMYDKRVDMWHQANPGVKRKGSRRVASSSPSRQSSDQSFDALFE